jgi:hypothetical protein
MTRKPIIQAICNNMGTILVVRSPRSRQWLFNLSVSNNLVNTLKGHTMKTLITACLLFASFLICACGENPVSAQTDKKVKAPLDTLAMISTRYISEDSVSRSCWYAWTTDNTRDSLALNGKKYTVSKGSRYRAMPEPEWLGDTVLEGAVKYIDPIRLYKDTKTDSIYILNPCAGRDSLNAMEGK